MADRGRRNEREKESGEEAHPAMLPHRPPQGRPRRASPFGGKDAAGVLGGVTPVLRDSSQALRKGRGVKRPLSTSRESTRHQRSSTVAYTPRKSSA